MLQWLRRLGVSLIAVVALLLPALIPITVHAQDIQSGLCAGVNLDVTNTNCDPSADQEAVDKINNILKTIINIFSLIVGVVSVVMIIVGGLKFITSGGDASNVSNAQRTIIYAIVGLVVVALAQVLVRFVLIKATQS